MPGLRHTSIDSKTINKPRSDLAVVSSDGVRFRIHKRNLAAASAVFDDMLEVGGDAGGDGVTLVEPASVLQRVLPFIYPQVIPTFDLHFPEDDPFVEALFKYEIVRGIEVVGQQLQRGTVAPALADLGRSVRALRVAIYLEDIKLAKCHMKQLVEVLVKSQDVKGTIVSLEGVPPWFKEDLINRVSEYLLQVSTIRDAAITGADSNTAKAAEWHASCRKLWTRASTRRTQNELHLSRSEVELAGSSCFCLRFHLAALEQAIASVENLDFDFDIPSHEFV